MTILPIFLKGPSILQEISNCEILPILKKHTAFCKNVSEKERDLASWLYWQKKERKREKNERELPNSDLELKIGPF